MIDLWVGDKQVFKIRCSITECSRHKHCICNAYRLPGASFVPKTMGHLDQEGQLSVECRSRS